MTDLVVFYASDDVTLLTVHNFPLTVAGAASAVVQANAWCIKGTAGAGVASLYFQIEVEWPYGSGVYYSNGAAYSGGIAPLDRRDFQARIIGSSNPGPDELYLPYTTGWTRLGSSRVLTAPAMRGDCGLNLEVRHAPILEAGAGEAAFRWLLRPVWDEGLGGEQRVLRLRKDGSEATGTDLDHVRIPWACQVQQVVASWRTAAGGASGASEVDVLLDGTTILSSVISIAAGDLTATGSPSTVDLPAGSWLSIDVPTITTGGTQAIDLDVSVIVSRT